MSKHYIAPICIVLIGAAAIVFCMVVGPNCEDRIHSECLRSHRVGYPMKIGQMHTIQHRTVCDEYGPKHIDECVGGKLTCQPSQSVPPSGQPQER